MTTIEKAERKDIKRRYEAMMRSLPTADIEDNVGKVNCYTCGTCHRVTKTIIRDKGHDPRGIVCPYCGEEAMSSNYHDLMPGAEPTHEFYRPSLVDCYGLRNAPVQISFVLSGGLLKREIEK